MNPTKLIYKAGKGKTITTPKGKTIFYDFKDGNKEGYCYICGRHTTKGFDKKKIIKPTFTDQQYCNARDSDIVCEYCSFCLSFSELRNYGIFATETKLIHPDTGQYVDIILRNKETPFVLCIPTSGQKWLHIKAEVNYETEKMAVNLEEQTILFNRSEFSYLFQELDGLYNSDFKFTKDEIEKLEFNSSKILEYGLCNYEKMMGKLGKYKGTSLMKLCVYLLKKKGEKS